MDRADGPLAHLRNARLRAAWMRAADQIPKHEQAAEAVGLRKRYERARGSRRTGPQAISEILLAVLARYGITGLESELEAQGPGASSSDTSTG